MNSGREEISELSIEEPVSFLIDNVHLISVPNEKELQRLLQLLED